MRSFKSFGSALAGAATLVLANTALAQKDIVIGLQCDRTGPTQTVGVFICPGYHDYIALVN
jgi:branched-chain amino acid transport system substrate-binding protein